MSRFLRDAWELAAKVASAPADIIEGIANGIAGGSVGSYRREPQKKDYARDFYEAIRVGNEAGAKELLNHREDKGGPAFQFPLGAGILAFAANERMTSVVRELAITHGISPNDRLQQVAGHMTAMHAAVLNHDVPTMLELMAVGADPGATYSPYNGVRDAAGRVLFTDDTLPKSFGTSFNAHLSPLDLALEIGDHEMIGAMVGAGAKLDAPNASGFTPMAVATAYGRHKSIEILQSYGVKNDDASMKNDPSRIFAAAIQGNTTEMARLVAAGCDINQRDAEGFTPLMLAAKNKQAEMVHFLVEAKADVNTVYIKPIHNSEQRAIDFACEAWGGSQPKYMGAIKALADAGSPRPAYSNFGWNSKVPEFLDDIYGQKTPESPKSSHDKLRL